MKKIESVSFGHKVSSLRMATNTTEITIGQIAKVLRCHERTARLYLREVNGSIDCYVQNRGEVVDHKTVIALQHRYANNVLAKRLKSLTLGI